MQLCNLVNKHIPSILEMMILKTFVLHQASQNNIATHVFAERREWKKFRKLEEWFQNIILRGSEF